MKGRQTAFLRAIALFVIFLLPPVLPIGRCATVDWSGDLQPGTHVVGFETLEHYDHTRTLRSSRDYFGAPLPGEVARSVQIVLWYPAEVGADEQRMVYGEYSFPYPSDTRHLDYLAQLHEREIEYLHALLGDDRGLVLDMMNVEVGATRDLPPASNRAPLIVYSPDRGHGAAENAALCEYLASHGWVVAATHCVGPRGAGTAVDAETVETQARDLEFILATLHEDPRVDASRVALIGAGTGGYAALLTAMRDTRVRALAWLAGAGDVPVRHAGIESLMWFDASRMRVPILAVHRGSDVSAVRALIEPMTYAHRSIVSVGTSSLRPGVGLTSYGIISALRGEGGADSAAVYRQVYEYSCTGVEAFLAAYLGEGDSGGEYTLDDPDQGGLIERTETLRATAAPPTPDQFRSILEAHGAGRAAELFDQFDLAVRNPPILPESYMNAAGYQLLRSGRTPDAVAVFRMCAEAYPLSANAWDSYGEACLQHGDRAQALTCYRQALEVIPRDTTTPAQTKEWISNHAQEVIPQLEQPEEP